ncbi:hypothetical protein [uncultured Bacteroides sp.]|uniref:hypothetical protein n=1 Tax=uncultured Bacteroides sp. TaxID=162156 RepID=UPI00262CF9FB|nr:hypothetical protein [uncultured Bacteroides sp.]
MMKSITKRVFSSVMMLCLLTTTGLNLTSCEQEDSKDLGDAPLFQNYMLAVGNNGETVAYAAFSKERNDFLKPVKMTGEQKITVNGKNMNYNRLDKFHTVAYSYSLKLDNNVKEAEFSFVRFKDKILTNKLAKDNSLALILPEELKTLEAGKAVNWKGAAKAADETMEIMLEKANKRQYLQHFGEVTEDGKGFVFQSLPEKGKYKLTVRRYKSVPTVQNDRTADGEMFLCYYDSRIIEIK